MKTAEEDLRVWRQERNITKVSKTIKNDMLEEYHEAEDELQKGNMGAFVEERVDNVILALNYLGLNNLEFKNIRVTQYNENPLLNEINKIDLNKPVVTFIAMCTIIQICKQMILEAGYDFEKVLNEKIKVLNSRRQNVIQAIDWAENGASGKWKKQKDQKDVYVGDFEGCKI